MDLDPRRWRALPVILLEPVDLVLFSVKSYDTQSASGLLPPLMAPRTAVLTLQNGVENGDALAAVVGAGAVLLGAVYVALQLAGPGLVVQTGGEGKIAFGERNGPVTERIRAIASAFQQAGIVHEVSADIERVLWEKLLFITGIGGVTALARAGIGPLLAVSSARPLHQPPAFMPR